MKTEIGVQEISITVNEDYLIIKFQDADNSIHLNDLEIEVLLRLISIAQKRRDEQL